MNNLPWYKARPEHLKKEEEALAAAGVAYRIDTLAESQGILKIGFVIDSENPLFDLSGRTQPLRLEAHFPDNYPYFRPEVHAEGLDLPRHYNPIGGNLCLLPRPTDNWEPEWTLVSYLQSQLPKLLMKGAITDPDEIAADPAEQAEPASEYYPVERNPFLFNSSFFDGLTTAEAEAVQIGKVKVGVPDKAELPCRMAILEAFSMDGTAASQLPSSLQKLFPVRCEGALLRLSVRPPHGNAGQDLDWLQRLVEKQGKRFDFLGRSVKVGDKYRINGVIGLNFPEEVGKGAMGRGWLFLVVASFMEPVTIGSRRMPPRPHKMVYYAKAIRTGEDELGLRVPQLVGLKRHKIAVAGLGTLGGPSALEFARNQVAELRLMDYDVVEPGPTVRWPLGLALAGLLKAEALSTFIEENYPQTKVFPMFHRIGGVRAVHPNDPSGLPTEQKVMDQFLDSVSMLYDATAEIGVSHFLSRQAQRLGIPYVGIHATPGAWGGLVMRVVPGKTQGCWMCLKHWQMEDTALVPVKDDAGEVQAAGCGDLTFTGTSFDLQNVVLAGVRLAISSLLGNTAGGYPDADWDVGVLALRKSANELVPPQWETYPLHIHPDCPYCLGR